MIAILSPWLDDDRTALLLDLRRAEREAAVIASRRLVWRGP